MAKDSKSFNTSLYKLLRSRGYHPVSKDFKNDSVGAPQEADVIEFTPFGENDKKGKDKAWISIDDGGQLTVYYDDEQVKGSFDAHGNDKSWTAFLKNLKNWAMRKQLGFELSNKDHLGYDMKQREHNKMKEKVSEGYHAMGKAKSYNDNVPEVKIVLQHSRNIEEGEQRYRNVAKIYLENVDGERILAPTNKPGVAQIYARHLAEGGNPHDERWNHLKGLCEEYNKMAGFVRATRNGEFTESAQRLVQEGINHYNKLRESLSKMRGSRGYNAYFESWSPPLMEDESDDTINELFVQETMDPRIESVMPILSRLRKNVVEMTEVGVLESWADNVISEKLELDEYDDHEMADTKTDMRKTGDQVTDAHDKAYATLKRMAPELYNFIRNEAPMPIDPIQTVDYLRQSGGNAGQLLRMLKDHIKADTEKQYDKKHPSLAESMKRFLETLINEGLKDTGWMDKDEAEDGTVPAFMRKKKYDDKMKDATGGPAVRTAKNKPDEEIDENFINMAPQAVAEGDESDLESFLEKYPEAKEAMHNAVRHFEYAYDAMDHVAGHVLHKMPYADFDKIRPHLIAYFEKYGLKGDDQIEEDLDSNQKRVGQLGPTEKVKNNNIGKLVGANESTEYNEELARMMEIARFRR